MPLPPLASLVWPPPPPAPHLAPGDVHLWLATTDLPADALSHLRSLLTPDEIDRAARYRFDPDRTRYITARGTLRRLLALYTNIQPQQIRLISGPHGKPALDAPDAPRFNLSHAGRFILYAFCPDRDLGIDIEPARQELDPLAVSSRTFHPAEARAIAAAPEAERLDLFYRIWTCKEAYLKLIARGMSAGLSQAAVEIAADGTPTIRAAGTIADAGLRPFSPAPAHYAALAIAGQTPFTTHCFSAQ